MFSFVMNLVLKDTDEFSNFRNIEDSATAEMELIELQNNDLLKRTHEKSGSVITRSRPKYRVDTMSFLQKSPIFAASVDWL